ncbi:MAG: hypothetical protein JXR65_11470 [Bacteroidales bacterium]|nr:hypothetical protein [Bacteroidales bacterium]
MNKKNQIKVLLLIFMLPLLVSCSSKKEKSNTQKSTNLSHVLPSNDVATITGIGLVEPEGKIVNLSLSKNGTISRIFKHSGEKVNKGDTLLCLDQTNDRLVLEELQAKKQSLILTVKQNEAQVEETQNKLNNAESNLVQTRELFAKGAVTQQQLDNEQLNTKVLQIQFEQNKLAVQQSQAQVNELNVSIAQANKTLSDDILKAPSSGTVLEVLEPIYTGVQAYQNLVEFASNGAVVVRCQIDEMFADYVKPGQKVEVRNVGFSKVIAEGTVQKALPFLKQKSLFSDNPTDQQDRRVREVIIVLNNPNGLLFNSRVECTIHNK